MPVGDIDIKYIFFNIYGGRLYFNEENIIFPVSVTLYRHNIDTAKTALE